MTYIGIGSPIPDISSLPGQIGGEVEVTLDYPSAAVCNGDDAFSPSSATPPGGTFEAEPSGLNINSSTGVVTPVGSTPQAYTISYTVSGVTSQFALTINNVEQSTFSYSASSFQKIGTATPTLASGTTAGGDFSASTGVVINTSTGVIDLAASTIGGPYTITYTTPGACSTSSTFTLSITAVSVELIDNSFVMEFDGTDDYVSAGNSISQSFSELSISTWINAASTASGAYDTIIRRGTWSAGAFELRNNASYAGLKFAIYPGTANVTTTGVTLNDGNWHHILVTYDGTNVKIYVDGSLNNSSTNGTGATGTNTQITTIGASEQGTQRYWNGNIDEVAIWSRALELTDVQRIYNATANNPGKTANLFTAGLNTGLVLWNRMGD